MKTETRGNTKQTLLSLPNVRFINQQAMADVPNVEGFRLLGILPNMLAMPLTVRKDANGCHYLADQFNSYRSTSIFTGWIKETN